MIRSDLSSKLIHLTRTVDGLSAEERFRRILAEGRLLGSRRDVRGGFAVVAFTEAPIGSLASVLAIAREQQMRYTPLGVMVDKRWLYERGGRPVIYQSNVEFDELPQSKQHLHVRYEPDKGIDYSWEREWRVKADSLELNPEQTTIVVPSRLWERHYHSEHTGRHKRAALVTHGMWPMAPPRWHFVALSDLGIPFDGLEPVSFQEIK
jgi:hypothetical protein